MMLADERVASWMRDLDESNPALHAVLRFAGVFFDFIGHGLTQVIIIVSLMLLGRLFMSAEARRTGRLLLAGFLFSGIAVQILKHLFGRARPRLGEGVLFIGPTLKSGFDSFPSGHTTVAFTLAYILSSRYPRGGAAFYATAFMIALGRVVMVSHYISDIVVGAAMGLAIGQILINKIDKSFSK